MRQVVLVTVKYPLGYLPYQHFSHALFQFALLSHVLQQVPALEVLHDDDHLHVLHGEALAHPHYVFVLQGFQDLGLDEDRVYIPHATDVLRLYYLYGEVPVGLLVPRQVHLAVSPLSQ